MSSIWPYGCYDEYLDYQQRRARQSRGLTRRAAAKRDSVVRLLRRFAPQARSLLCLGARDVSEVDDFRQAGYDAEGIDLAGDDGVAQCDMSNLDGDDRFRERQFDVFVMLHSLGHCWDLEGFQRRSLPHCRQVLVAVLPCRREPRPSRWECRTFDVQQPDGDVSSLSGALPGFAVVHHEYRDDQIILVLRRTPDSGAVNRRRDMKNLMTANWLPDSKYRREDLENLLRAQIENSLEVGWRLDDIVLVTNFAFEYEGVRAHTTALNEHCPRGSKLYAVRWCLRERLVEGAVWAHDLDCWQNMWFDAPEFADVGACHYSQPKFNGGSVFWRPRAVDILDEIIGRLDRDAADREEPTLDRVFKQRNFARRVTILNSTYNLGCSGFQVRLDRSRRPVRVCHFHPTNRIAWETHALDRNGLGERSVAPRLERVLRRWYPRLSNELSEKGRAKRNAALASSKTS
ncbi:MAG: hypothetical protein RIC55_26375 [Pirellulaceae bacterium]